MATIPYRPDNFHKETSMLSELHFVLNTRQGILFSPNEKVTFSEKSIVSWSHKSWKKKKMFWLKSCTFAPSLPHDLFRSVSYWKHKETLFLKSLFTLNLPWNRVCICLLVFSLGQSFVFSSIFLFSLKTSISELL